MYLYSYTYDDLISIYAVYTRVLCIRQKLFNWFPRNQNNVSQIKTKTNHWFSAHYLIKPEVPMTTYVQIK